MKKYLVILISFVVSTVQAQQIVVPENLNFADIRLNLDAAARAKIQKNVDYLLQHPVYFQQKVERADIYFPIITRVFREAGLPEDFKYLALQESGLNPDAISTSKAEGFWQFKKETALDYGLKINSEVDERRHIIEASRGAAKYFVQSNAYYKNWINSLVSYYMGFTGAKAYARPGDADNKDMRITAQTHVYFLTFLAHKIAYENSVGKSAQPAVSLKEMHATPGLSLAELALNHQTEEAELVKYNRWLLASAVPADKDYTLFIPVANLTPAGPVLASAAPAADGEKLPEVTQSQTVVIWGQKVQFATLNGLKVIIAQPGDTKDKLALQAKISTRKFLKLNDLYSFEQIVPGKAYYLEKKNTRASAKFHTVQTGETLLDIAQAYGIRLKAIVSKNRMKKNEALVAGRVLWLQQTRPSNMAVEYRRVEAQPEKLKMPEPVLNNDLTAENKPEGKAAQIGTTVLTGIKETASNTFHKAGHAINVPEKQPEVAQVGGGVFDEAIELNPKPKTATVTTTAPAPAETVAPNPEKVTETPKPVAEKIIEPEITTPSKTETEQAAISENPAPTTDLTETVATKEPVAVKPETKLPDPATTSPTTVTPAEPDPKTVAITPEKGIENEKPAEISPATAEPEINKEIAKETAETQTPEKPKVILKDPVVTSGPKSVTVPTKKPEPTTSTPVRPATHKVAKGETLYAIARKYSISPSDLKYWNNLGEKPLAIGQELVLQGAAKPVMPVLTLTAPDKPVPEGTTVIITHKVGEGESMYQISRKYGVSIKDIMEWNNKADFNVSAGDQLIVKSVPGASRN
jgi:membrane-bound lytic murein transglycosylase D